LISAAGLPAAAGRNIRPPASGLMDTLGDFDGFGEAVFD
jgi:hypothetical protein